MDKKSRDYEVCLCRHVTRGEIEDIIRKERITDLVTLCKASNTGNVCGGCREDLEMILNDVWNPGKIK